MLCEQQIQSDFLRATTNHLHQWYNPLYLVETAIVMRQSNNNNNNNDRLTAFDPGQPG